MKTILVVALTFMAAIPCSALHCNQIPADCITLGVYYNTFLTCIPWKALSCGALIVRGKLLAHPEDTTDYPFSNPHEIGHFAVDDVILSFGEPAPQKGDTLEVAHGGSCYGWYWPDSMEVVVGLWGGGWSRDSTDPVCYYFPGKTNFRLSYENGKVIGCIFSDSVDTMDYEEFKLSVIQKVSILDGGRRVRMGATEPKVWATKTAEDRLIVSGFNRDYEDRREVLLCDLAGKLIMKGRVDDKGNAVFILPQKRISPHGILIVKSGTFAKYLLMR